MSSALDSLGYSIIGGLISAGIITLVLYSFDARKKTKRKKLAYREISRSIIQLDTNFTSILKDIPLQDTPRIKEGQSQRIEAVKGITSILLDTLHHYSDILDSDFLHELKKLANDLSQGDAFGFNPANYLADSKMMDFMISQQIEFPSENISRFQKIQSNLQSYDYKLFDNEYKELFENYEKSQNREIYNLLHNHQEIIIDHKGTYSNLQNSLLAPIRQYYDDSRM
ncbi:MAG: hypothetical protein IIC67_01020 [Thaumarchaeota archaeon]|nr:hypothetical protein [Nitrososphaerota archaeon]